MLSNNTSLDATVISAVEQQQNQELRKILESLSSAELSRVVNYQRKDKETALHLAINNRDLATVNILLEFGADPNIKGFFNETSLHRACALNAVEIVKMLLFKNADLNVSATDATKPIHQAAENNAVDVVKFLLDRDDAQLQLISKEGRTPFFHASINEATSVIEILLMYGDEINKQNPYDNRKSALHLAAIKNNAQLAAFLISKGADVNITDGGKFTPLQRCILQPEFSLETAKILIQNGADVNAGNPPPLHMLAVHENQGSTEIVKFAKLLLKNNCDITAAINGETALEILAEKADNLEDDQLGLFHLLKEWELQNKQHLNTSSQKNNT